MTEEDIDFINFLVLENGYRHVRILPNNRYAAVLPLMFTSAIVIGNMHDRFGYEDRWCYHSGTEANTALEAWDGEGEPTGWHRHPRSGRRVSPEGEEYINP